MLVVPIGVHLLAFHDWYTWRVKLRNRDQEVRKEFVLPTGFDWGKVSSATLQIDVWDKDGQVHRLDVRLNGERLNELVKLRSVSPALRAVVLHHTPMQLADLTRTDIAPSRRTWAVYRLRPESLQGIERLAVSVRLQGAQHQGANSTFIYGDLAHGDPDQFEGPRLWGDAKLLKEGLTLQYGARESIWRYQTYRDVRLYGNTRLIGRNESVYREGKRESREDLSDAFLQQNGSFRIHVQLLTKDGRELAL